MPPSHQFKHFVNYHNPDTMGYEFDKVTDFVCATNKQIGDLVGNRVWLVGRRSGSSDVFLFGTFKIANVEKGAFGAFHTLISGTSGQRYNPAVRLDPLPWFSALKTSMANFSLGFQRVMPGPALEGLQAIKDAAGKA